MDVIPVGRSRFDAVPKEQPPRKLSGKRTTGDQQELWRVATVIGGSPKG
jgi:hypothetical protein